MKTILTICFVGCFGFSTSSYSQQICDDSLPAWTPTSQFEQSSEGLVTHNKTGLVWAKCEVGKLGVDCAGEAQTMGWDQAMTFAESFNAGGFTDWRLPNIQELLSIAEDRCLDPSVNLEVFPNTSSGSVWTSWKSEDIQNGAWFVRFSDGTPGLQFKGEKINVRLVRGGG